MKTKSIRRHHRERLKAARRFYYAVRYKDVGGNVQKISARDVKPDPHYTDNPTPCSCWMCRNERRNGDKTMAELRADLSYREQLS